MLLYPRISANNVTRNMNIINHEIFTFLFFCNRTITGTILGYTPFITLLYMLVHIIVHDSIKNINILKISREL